MLPRRETPLSPSGAPDYTRFLYAEVWVEASGMPLSVVSALARLNLDASREALRLATLPRVAAGITLSKAITRLPNPPPAVDVAATAARLVLLLPDLPPRDSNGRDSNQCDPNRRDLTQPVAIAGSTLPRRVRSLLGWPRAWQLGLIVVLSAWLVYAVVDRSAGGSDAGPNDAGPPRSIAATTTAPGLR